MQGIGCLFAASGIGVALGWAPPASADEPMVSMAQQMVDRYGAQLPALSPPANNTPPPGCAATPLIHAVAQDKVAKLAFVLHSQHFECAYPDGGYTWSSYATALSVVDEITGSPVLISTTSVADPVNGASDVVDWTASLRTFWLSSGVLGVAVRTDGAISGSGIIAQANDAVFAVVGRGLPQLLLNVPSNAFGKSNIDNADGETVRLTVTKPKPRRPTFFGVVTSRWATVDGIDQDVPPVAELYRFDARQVALVKVNAASVAASAWTLIGPAEPQPLADVAAAPRQPPTKK